VSAIPAFEIGVWNAWIFTIFIFLCVFLSQIIKGVGEKIAHSEEENKLNRYVALVSILMVIYSIFLPLKLGTVWFYTGLSIFIVGLIVQIITIVNVATTPKGEPFTKGAYHYSRNPLSLGMLFTFLGIGIASASWLFLLLSITIAIITHFMIFAEEHSCLKKFGDSYRDYMNRTPRWIGIRNPKGG
jgi:protein-S-isoprenylcysteine O-methyltransferase Ste14